MVRSGRPRRRRRLGAQRDLTACHDVDPAPWRPSRGGDCRACRLPRECDAWRLGAGKIVPRRWGIASLGSAIEAFMRRACGVAVTARVAGAGGALEISIFHPGVYRATALMSALATVCGPERRSDGRGRAIAHRSACGRRGHRPPAAAGLCRERRSAPGCTRLSEGAPGKRGHAGEQPFPAPPPQSSSSLPGMKRGTTGIASAMNRCSRASASASVSPPRSGVMRRMSAPSWRPVVRESQMTDAFTR